MNKRPLSPFMLGPYYRLQLTSVLSITHRITGVILSVAGIPLVLCWIVAVNNGAVAYAEFTECVKSPLGILLGIGLLFSLSFHFFNGIRHLVWDTGRWLDLEAAYRSGWLVLAASVLLTVAVLWGVWA